MSGASAPVLASSSTSAPGTAWLHLHGFPWSADEAAVRAAVLPPIQLAGGSAPQQIFLPLDRQARPSGRALLQFACGSNGPDAAALVDVLQGLEVGGRRYLEVRVSSGGEAEEARRRSNEATARAEGLAPQAFLGTREDATRPAPPGDRRELVVLCHGTPEAVARGKFELNDLSSGRVDLLVRCVASALFYSHGVRKNVRVWLMLRDVRRTVCWYPPPRVEHQGRRGLVLSCLAGGEEGLRPRVRLPP